MLNFHNQNREYRPVTAALACHPERSEGSLSMGSEMLRGVYLERSEGLSMTGPTLNGKPHYRARVRRGILSGGRSRRRSAAPWDIC